MKRFALPVALILLLPVAAAASPQADRDDVFKRVHQIALSAFPRGTTDYQLYWIPAGSTKPADDLIALISTAKKQSARWVLASDDATTLKDRLLVALQQTDSNDEGRTEIVVISPIASDEELLKAAQPAGVSLEFLLISPTGQ